MKEEIKNRIEAVRRGEVPEGYCRTRAGYMPNEWDQEIRAKDVFKNYTNKRHGGNYEVLSATQEKGIIPRSEVDIDIKYDESSVDSYKKVDVGDFVISLRSFQGGIEYSAYEGLVSPAYTVLKNKLPIDDGYYKAYFKTSDFINRLNGAVYGIRDGKQIGFEDFGDLAIHYPPLPEQQKIAELLAACDKVIELKQKLIEEKRRQKKWLTQKLLDPDSGVRLPGFEGSKWTSYQIKDVAEVINGGTPDTSLEEYWNGEVLWCTPSDISAAKKYISSTSQKITDKGLSNSSATLLPVGAILMCSRATIGPRAIATLPITTNQGFKSFVCKEQINNEFFYYYLDVVVPNFLKLSAGNTFKEVSKADVEKEIIHIPALPEQIAIVSILSSVDKQIELYEQELAKWQQKKKALMQLLLTGLVRVNA